jgi:hypothetical protein
VGISEMEGREPTECTIYGLIVVRSFLHPLHVLIIIMDTRLRLRARVLHLHDCPRRPRRLRHETRFTRSMARPMQRR